MSRPTWILSLVPALLAGAAIAQQAPRTPWGDPDIAGTYTSDNWIGVPFQRPEQPSRATSMIVDPPDSRLPAMTPEGRPRVAERRSHRRRPPESYQDFSNYDRCISRGVTGSIIPVVYGNGAMHSEDLRLVERFTRVDEDTLRYEFTVEDPRTYTQPWTARFDLDEKPGYEVFEYACHEGNYGLANMLSAARAGEQAAEE